MTEFEKISALGQGRNLGSERESLYSVETLVMEHEPIAYSSPFAGQKEGVVIERFDGAYCCSRRSC